MISPHKRVREQKVNLRAACQESNPQQDTKVESKRHELDGCFWAGLHRGVKTLTSRHLLLQRLGV